TTSALVAFAGAAAADGHTSFTWGGSATAGVAREGGSPAVATKATANDILTLQADYDALTTVVTSTGATEATLRADLADEIAAQTRAVAALNPSANVATNASVVALAAAQDLLALLNKVSGASDIVANGDFDTYSEVSLTAAGSVTLDSGVTVTAAVSVDAGTGYDFADDDGFDAAKTNGVSLDSVTIDGGTLGALTIDDNNVAHLVDGDDDATGDLKYTYSNGAYDFALVYDIQKDADPIAVRGGFTRAATPAGAAAEITDVAAVAADVAWSAKLDYTISDSLAVYGALDEEGGNTVGGSYSAAGFTVSASSALEALQEQLNEDRSNTLTVGYTAGAVTVGATYNSVADGNQWSANAAYAVNGLSLAASTNEAESWSLTAGYELADSASIVGGVNYTDDAYVGVKFDF
ncbi:porin, partial [Octadecabacter sp.]|nr:porin [Octadecabacter sp.]